MLLGYQKCRVVSRIEHAVILFNVNSFLAYRCIEYDEPITKNSKQYKFNAKHKNAFIRHKRQQTQKNGHFWIDFCWRQRYFMQLLIINRIPEHLLITRLLLFPINEMQTNHFNIKAVIFISKGEEFICLRCSGRSLKFGDVIKY